MFSLCAKYFVSTYLRVKNYAVRQCAVIETNRRNLCWDKLKVNITFEAASGESQYLIINIYH